MKAVVALLACFVVAGCASWLPDERVVGHFVATNGATLDISADGRIFYEHDARKEFVGMVSVTRDTPLTIFVVAPDGSPFTGTVITFSANRQNLTVEWRDVLRQRPRAKQFKKRS